MLQPKISSTVLSSMKDRLRERSDVPGVKFQHNSLCAIHFDGLALETRFGAINETTAEFQLCVCCHESLCRHGDRPPRLALANFLSRGTVPLELSELTWAERRLIALYRPSIYILTLQKDYRLPLNGSDKVQPALVDEEVQAWKIRGHCIGNL